MKIIMLPVLSSFHNKKPFAVTQKRSLACDICPEAIKNTAHSFIITICDVKTSALMDNLLASLHYNFARF